MDPYALLCGVCVFALLAGAEGSSGRPPAPVAALHGHVAPPVQGHREIQSRNFHIRPAPPTAKRAPAPSPVHLLALIQKSTIASAEEHYILHIICSTLCAAGSCCLFFLSMLQTGKLFSQGIWSKKFFRSGGYCLVGAACAGALLGVGLALAMDATYYIPYLASGFMLIGASVIYIGRRGAIVGTTGGLMVGLTFGVIHSGSMSATIVEGVLCMFSGVAIGFIPIFPNLKMNARYIQHGVETMSLASRVSQA